MRVSITDTAYRGNGVGRDEAGKAVFVPYSVTGDVLDVKIIEDKRSYWLAEIEQIIEPSPWRIKPLCPHHGICGGCHFGHINYENQLSIKQSIITQALRKHSQAADIAFMMESFHSEPFGYRIRASVRTVGGKAGFFMRGSNSFIAVEDCPVIKGSLYAKCSKWAKPAGLMAKQGLNGVLSVIEAPSGMAIAAFDGVINPAGFAADKEPFDGLMSGDTRSGLKHLIYDTAAGPVPVDYGGFFQSNRFLIDRFQTYAAENAQGKILELYAGSGFFTAALMQKGEVEATELNTSAARLARDYGYPVKAASSSQSIIASKKYDSVFIDPPREGMDKRTTEQLLKLGSERFIYVSCNPMTLARDLEKLSGIYKLNKLAFFDMFPQTFHVETVAVLERY